MLLTIGKATEFGTDDLPIRGQCQPYTKGWSLRIVEEGQEEVLFTDTYHACRQMQMACRGKSTLEEMRAIVHDLKEQLAGDLQETAVFEDQEETQPVMPPDVDEDSTLTAPDDPSLEPPQSEDTVHLPKEEMEAILRKRRKDFEF
ncbi:MAG: hypothetical protein ACYTGH_09080 [Planctomycetota bacterium]|jgi:hypothetical protein